MIKDFKFLSAAKQSINPIGYVPYVHIPNDELIQMGTRPSYRQLSLCQYPTRLNNEYEGFSFVWEPRDIINKEYRIASWTGSIKDFWRHYENRRMSLGSSPGEEYLPCYPRIRRIYVGSNYIINYNNAPRFMNPRFIFNHEFVRIEYKLYEDR